MSGSWHGLDPQLGKTPVHTAVQGSVGLAMEYSHEKSHSPRDRDVHVGTTADLTNTEK